MKICILQNYSTPYRMDLYREIAKEYDLTVVYMQDSKSEGRKWNVNEINENYNTITLENKYIWKFALNKGIVNIIRNGDFDMIIAIENLPNIISVISSSYISKKMNKKFILWTGEFEWHHYLKGRISKALYERLSDLYRMKLYKNSDAFITYGKETEKFLLSRGIDKNKIFSGSQCINTNKISYLKEINEKIRREKYSNKLTFITMAYLRKDKGIDRLINVFNEVNEIHKNIRLKIIGDGDSLEYLKSLANNNVEFLGYLDGDKKYEQLCDSDVFIFPTLKDSWGLVVNEAMEFGNIIVCSNRAACASELVVGNGYIYDPYKNDELKEVMEMIIDQDSRINILKDNSIKNIKKYSPEKIANNFKNAIDFVNGDDLYEEN